VAARVDGGTPRFELGIPLVSAQRSPLFISSDLHPVIPCLVVYRLDRSEPIFPAGCDLLPAEEPGPFGPELFSNTFEAH
jgi:hypothetical protein